ncbi:MAG: haloacid dehalogenase type II [Thermoplasmatales archaeon]
MTTVVGYLTFDCYGTLIDWRKGIDDSFRKFAEMGNSQNADIFENYLRIESKKESSYSSYRDILAGTFLDLANLFGLSTSTEKARGFADSVASWPPFDDTVSSLTELGKKGYKRIILSNVDRDLLKETISTNKLEVDGYITAEDIKSYKPQEAHWLRMLDEFGIRKEEVIHIAGSIYHDIVPASRLGFRTIWVNRYQEKKPTSVKPDYTVSSLSDVLTLI